jgi:hypothetical protein
MPSDLPLVVQTTYAELIELCSLDEFDAAFPPNGSFVAVPVKGRRYWYYQQGAKDESGQQPRKYLGPDNEHTAKLVARHGEIKSSYRQRRSLVGALRRYGLPTPLDETGKILRGLASQGVFRLRACVVGTVAYQTYAGVLGVKLPSPTLQTGDLDLAQSRAISVALAKDERTPAFLDVLKTIDPSFRAIPHLRNSNISVNYINGNKYRVEILTDNRGPNTDKPSSLPALRTYAQPLRYLDYLLYEPVSAVVLSDGGILVNVPQPERYAVHKLIVSQVRPATAVKGPKDLYQASALFDALAERRVSDLAAAWAEAYDRGPKWRKLLIDALTQIDSRGRDRLLYAIEKPRSLVSTLDIKFADAPPRYDFSRDIVLFAGTAIDRFKIECAVSREALADWFGAENSQDGRIEAFRKNRTEIEAMAREIYLNDPIPPDGAVLIKTLDVPRLRSSLKTPASRQSVKKSR